MNIETSWQSTPQLWMAYDAETMDGAPDASELSRVRGYSGTKEEAINDFAEKLAEYAYSEGVKDGLIFEAA